MIYSILGPDRLCLLSKIAIGYFLLVIYLELDISKNSRLIACYIDK